MVAQTKTAKPAAVNGNNVDDLSTLIDGAGLRKSELHRSHQGQRHQAGVRRGP
jgi:hypothetical protein